MLRPSLSFFGELCRNFVLLCQNAPIAFEKYYNISYNRRGVYGVLCRRTKGETLMLAIAIVEDDKKYSKLLESFLERYSKENDVKFKVDVFDDGLKFIMSCDVGKYNIIFMDVEMPRLDGIKTSRKLRATDKNASLIFVTNMAKYAVIGYEVDALDFIVKPVDYFNFSLKLEKAVRVQTKLMQDVILVGVGGGFTKLKTSDIQYVESSLHFVIYHTENEQIKSRASMKDTEKKLEAMNFARCNNAYLVNLACVKKVTGDEVIMDDGQILSISRSKKKSFMDALAVYYGGEL